MNILSLGGFAVALSLSTGFNETPDRTSRPFDIFRDGFVIGEGARIPVMEELSDALARAENARRRTLITSLPVR